MKKTVLVLFLNFLFITLCYSQRQVPQNTVEIKKAVIGFLKWYKTRSRDSTIKSYTLFKGGYPDTSSIMRVDSLGLEQYLNEFRQTHFVSETYLDNLKRLYLNIDNTLSKVVKSKELVKIPGLDQDVVLSTYEPEMILDHIDQLKIIHCYVIYRKALVSVYLSRFVKLLAVLTINNDNNWQIDYLGPDATDSKSLFKQ